MAERKRARQKRDVADDLQPTEDAIRKRAYEIYCARTSNPRGAVEDWLQAETELNEGRATGCGSRR
jgi:hypothetical protein